MIGETNWRDRVKEFRRVPASELRANPKNWREHPAEQRRALNGILEEVGIAGAVLARETEDGLELIDGHLRAEMDDATEWPVLVLDVNEAEADILLATIDPIGALASRNDAALTDLIASIATDKAALGEMLDAMEKDIPTQIEEGENTTLSERFGVPPFSVLNAREGWWQDRKRAWLSLGIQSELGRGESLIPNSKESVRPGGVGNAAGRDFSDRYNGGDAWAGHKSTTGTSIFDPVLCELVYNWFSPSGGMVLDPFAGGSVRGIVAARLGRQYCGVELRAEQVAANRVQAETICDGFAPVWHTGDSRQIDQICGDVSADLVFSCPPYADLEVYSDDPQDLSTLVYEDFKTAYFDIIAKACDRLKEDRFSCFVVGDVRDKKGNYYNFVGDTVEAFRAAGLHYYNEAILVTAVGSLPIRAGRQFAAGRKLGKAHQNVLIFCKGDPFKATENCGDCDFGTFEAERA